MTNSDRFQQQREALMALIASDLPEQADLMARLRRLCLRTATALEVARVGIWNFNKEGTALVCTLQFAGTQENFTSGVVLHQSDFPSYFEALKTGCLIDADDALGDPRTSSFSEPYLQPLGITSMLDGPIHLNGKLEGVLCCEHIGEKRTWHEDEKTFVLALANLVSLALESWERRQAELALQESRDHYQAIVSNLPLAVCRWRPDYTITYANSRYRKLFAEGAKVIGERWIDLLRPERQAEVERTIDDLIRDPKLLSYDNETQAQDGSHHWMTWFEVPIFDESGHLCEFQSVGIDITDRKRLEAKFHQAQKMESVGRLAGGIAHDFNNMLGIILGNVQLVLEECNAEDPIASELLEIEAAAQRSADLTRQLLAFARQQTIAPKVLDLNDAITQMLKMLRRLIGEGIDLDWRPTPRLWSVHIDPSQVDQILANLAVNARDALNGRGRIVISTANTVLDEAFCRKHVGAVPGEYVGLTFKDNGCGMDESTLERAFEPFYTTKDPGHGSGLGLATIYGIVKQNLGFVHLDSELGQGTKATLYFPRHLQAAQALNLGRSDPNNTLPNGDETVLIVEDEPSLLDLNRRLLERLGYKVLIAEGPVEALEVSRRFPGPIQLLLSDVIMPGMSGLEVSRHLHRIRPEMKNLFVSGYPANELAQHGVSEEDFHFLSKPYTSSDLAQKVREALET